MIANPIVEELILAGPTREVAMESYALEVEKHNIHLCCLNPETGKPNPDSVLYGFGTIRVCPPLRVAKRFRAFVTWLPVKGAN